MRTKTLLLAAVIFTAGLGVSLAQAPVYSVNAVGYVTKNLTNGFTCIANPLNGTNNSVNTIIPVATDGMYILKWVNGAFSDPSVYYAEFGVWFPEVTLNPGEGFFINYNGGAGTSTNITFVGEVPQGTLSNHLSVGFTLISHIVPQSLSLSAAAANFPALEADYILFWDRDNQRFADPTTYYAEFSVWFPVDPTPAVAEGFFYNTGVDRYWNRTFSVN